MKKKLSNTKVYNKIEEIEDGEEGEGDNGNNIEVDFWKEVASRICGLGLVVISYCVLLYLLSYTKKECPLS
jgi:hypothetical protein